MKLLRNLLKYLTVVLIIGGASSCSSDYDAGTPPVVEANIIAGFVAANDNYSSFEAALQITGLTSTLDGTENYTVFTRNNDAYEALLFENGFSALRRCL